MRGLAATVCSLVRTAAPILYRPAIRISHRDIVDRQFQFRATHTQSRTIMSSTLFFETLEHRRTIYDISNETTIPDSKVIDIVEKAVKHSPSAFNSQTTRAVVLFGSHHNKLWDIAIQSVLTTQGAERGKNRIDKTEKSFKGGYGTVLFFEDQAAIQAMKDRSPSMADYFPVWSSNTAGMVQLTVWTALEAEGLGASLQHFNPIIDEDVQKEFNLPSSWALSAQMPFGKPTQAPNPNKSFIPITDRVKSFGAKLDN